MKHTAQDFAQAEFARSTKNKNAKAMRRFGVNTDRPWVFMTSAGHSTLSDQEMANGPWTPVSTADPEEPRVPSRIPDPQALASFASAHGLRHDWHEPDESNISARIIGKHLDNAMGSTTRHEHADWGGEFNVVLTRMDEEEREIQEDLAVVNLATLLSWAAEHGRCQR